MVDSAFFVIQQALNSNIVAYDRFHTSRACIVHMMDIAAVLKELPEFVGPSKGAPAYGQNYLYGWYKPQNPHIVGLADEFSGDEEPQHNGVYRKVSF